MPYKAQWDTEQADLIRVMYSGNVLFEDYYRAIDACYTLVRSVSHGVYTTVEFTEATNQPWEVTGPLRYANDKMPENLLGSIAVGVRFPVTAQKFINMAYHMGMRRLNDVWVVADIDAARALVARFQAPDESP